MARPTKWRKIEHVPSVNHFVPEGSEVGNGLENVIKLEELEALRLKDLEGLDQEECALRMEVSRPTFQRILLSAREKVADCLINAKAIRIEGGNFTRNICPMVCLDCGFEWTESFEKMDQTSGIGRCAQCNSENVACGSSRRGRFCRGNCRRYGNNK